MKLDSHTSYIECTTDREAATHLYVKLARNINAVTRLPIVLTDMVADYTCLELGAVIRAKIWRVSASRLAYYRHLFVELYGIGRTTRFRWHPHIYTTWQQLTLSLANHVKLTFFSTLNWRIQEHECIRDLAERDIDDRWRADLMTFILQHACKRDVTTAAGRNNPQSSNILINST